MRNLEAEFAAAAEETQPARKRRKLASLMGLEEMKETEEADEENTGESKDYQAQLQSRKTIADDKEIWNWL